MVGLIDHDDFELLLCALINLLCLCNFFQQVLNNDSIIVPNVRRCNLKMVYRGDDVEFELAVASCLENARVDFDLFDSRSIQFLECRYNSSLFACTRGAINQKMREISTLCLR